MRSSARRVDVTDFTTNTETLFFWFPSRDSGSILRTFANNAPDFYATLKFESGGKSRFWSYGSLAWRIEILLGVLDLFDIIFVIARNERRPRYIYY